jgi:hypothetical protein
MNTTNTTNGMPANKSSLNSCVDLFYMIGASRGQDVIPSFEKAIIENRDIAVRIAQWVRDIRGGAGERQIFRDILVYLANTDEDACSALIQKTPEVGRWDDLLVLFDTPMELDALAMIETGLVVEQNPLCAKWMPRKGMVAVKLRNHLNMSPKRYRKTLVNLTKVVESDMCAGNWDDIDFGKLPSVASSRYQKAFNRNAPESYSKFKDALSSGDASINAGAVYPYDVVKALKYGDNTVANAQWSELPNYMEGSSERIIPIVDVSGSMMCSVGGSESISCLDVAVSLGLYIAERNDGLFKDKFITFSSKPELVELSGSINARYKTMVQSDWGMSTDIEKVFSLILKNAVDYNVAEAHMPTKVLVLSDMQFDRCAKANHTVMDMIEEQYTEAGYKMPEIIFWNIHNQCANVPVTFDKQGVALVSGFSPSLMTSVIACESLNPVTMMKHAVCIDKYDWC